MDLLFVCYCSTRLSLSSVCTLYFPQCSYSDPFVVLSIPLSCLWCCELFFQRCWELLWASSLYGSWPESLFTWPSNDWSTTVMISMHRLCSSQPLLDWPSIYCEFICTFFLVDEKILAFFKSFPGLELDFNVGLDLMTSKCVERNSVRLYKVDFSESLFDCCNVLVFRLNEMQTAAKNSY